jgi:hypothetical protein
MTEFTIHIIDKGASSEIMKEKFSLDQEGITNWLISKNIIVDTETLTNFKDLTPWTRTGGETYGTTFEFSTTKYTKQIFVKAIVTISPEKSLLDWSRRRKILMENAMPVSKWYYFGDGVIFEDLYPLTSQFVSFHEILSIGYRLDQLGFSTLKFADDIRSDKNGNPFYIDFGFDLGEPSNKINSAAMNYLLLKYPETSDEIRKIYSL